MNGDPQPAGDVLLAASWGPRSYELLTLAAGLASTHGRAVRLVHVVRDVDWLLDPRPADVLLDEALHRAHLLLTDTSAMIGDLAPGVAVHHRLLLGSLYDATLGEAASAGMAVVGHGLLAAWLREHATCPITTPSEGIRRVVTSPHRIV